MANRISGAAHPLYKHGDTTKPHANRAGKSSYRATRLYRAWHHLKDDKTVRLDPEWAKSYIKFKTWALANGYSEENEMIHFTRRDKNLGWYPDNTVIGPLVGASHTFLTHDGITMTLCDWARKIGITKQCLWARLNQMHWTVEKALTYDTPATVECTFD